ncbi:MAG: hypothetical protein H7A52_09545 [Akkermansiaceae bacterium]|nr:hypothetical protein [Akkermansiaceae bacterium]
MEARPPFRGDENAGDAGNLRVLLLLLTFPQSVLVWLVVSALGFPAKVSYEDLLVGRVLPRLTEGLVDFARSLEPVGFMLEEIATAIAALHFFGFIWLIWSTRERVRMLYRWHIAATVGWFLISFWVLVFGVGLILPLIDVVLGLKIAPPEPFWRKETVATLGLCLWVGALVFLAFRLLKRSREKRSA